MTDDKYTDIKNIYL